MRARAGLLTPALRVRLGWMVIPIGRDKVQMLWHNGGTGGYRSFIGWTPATHTAVIALSGNTRSVDGFGSQVLLAVAAPAAHRT